jgi:hypothetical protein
VVVGRRWCDHTTPRDHTTGRHRPQPRQTVTHTNFSAPRTPLVNDQSDTSEPRWSGVLG